jgi:Flp pilus assembly protein TadB
MSPTLILLCVLIVGVTGSLGIITLFAPEREEALRALTGGSDPASISALRNRLQNDLSGEELARLKKLTKRARKIAPEEQLDERFFHAGLYRESKKRTYRQFCYILPFVTASIGICIAKYMEGGLIDWILLIAIGFGMGYQFPRFWLDHLIKKHSGEIMYYLPVVVEQIVIGVSSSLDIGPCIQGIIKMADERDNHNAVTELLRHCQHMMRSGVSMEEALHEVGRLSGHTELKHTFMALAQVVKHGGEVTKQLQELADAVSGQRETKIEAKIKRLELEATGPVGLVFLAFLGVLLIGISMQFIRAFGT